SRSAPVKAPRTWPNISLSIKVSDSEPQLTTRNGSLRRGDRSWIKRARRGFPVPVSPPTRSGVSTGPPRATRAGRRSSAASSMGVVDRGQRRVPRAPLERSRPVSEERRPEATFGAGGDSAGPARRGGVEGGRGCWRRGPLEGPWAGRRPVPGGVPGKERAPTPQKWREDGSAKQVP